MDMHCPSCKLRLARAAWTFIGGVLYHWCPDCSKQLELFKEEGDHPSAAQGRNLSRISEYLEVGERDSDPSDSSDLPW